MKKNEISVKKKKMKICDFELSWRLRVNKYITLRLNASPIHSHRLSGIKLMSLRKIKPFIQLIGFFSTLFDLIEKPYFPGVMCNHINILTLNNATQYNKIIEIPFWNSALYVPQFALNRNFNYADDRLNNTQICLMWFSLCLSYDTYKSFYIKCLYISILLQIVM